VRSLALGGGRVGAGLRGAQHAAERVAGAEQHVDRGGRDRLLGGPEAIEQGLEAVREAGDVVELEHARVALDRVCGPEDPIEQLEVARRALEIEHARFEVGEQLRRLLEEDLEHRVHRGGQ
jgi:hypothetical protein